MSINYPEEMNMQVCKVSKILMFVLILPAFLFAQEDVLVLVPSTGSDETFVNAQIIADTIATGGLLPNRVYELQRDQYYLVKTELRIAQPGEKLRIRAQSGDGALPVVYFWPRGGDTNPERPPGQWVRTQGGDLELTNIAVAGYYEPEVDYLDNVQGNMFRNDAAGSSFIFDGCIFSNINGQILRTENNAVKVSITNCIFANLGSLTTSNLGAGKGIDLRASECVELIVENNTFVNYQDRVIRHYNFSNPEAGTGLIHYGRIDHNTIINGMGYHGLFSLGNVGTSMQITNNLFVDAFGLGEDSTDAVRAAEWANTGEVYANGNNRITWIFSAPNEVTNWTVSNNYFAISDSGQAFLDDFDFGPASPLSYHIEGKLAGGAATAFKKIDIDLADIPKMMTNFMRWYEDPSGGNKTKETGNYDKTTDDMDRREITYYRDTFDASYSTESEAYTGSTTGGPVGDLNWFDLVDAIEDDYTTHGPTSFMLSQNYPNPFNPVTTIGFSIPVNDHVSLTIYNTIGQKVAKLLDGNAKAGYHVVNWNANDFASGVYFYQLKFRNEVQTRKMILVK